jgi:hypothetical protein
MPHTGRLGRGFPLVAGVLLRSSNIISGLQLFRVVPSLSTDRTVSLLCRS